MEESKNKYKEKLEALHTVAIAATGNGRNHIQNLYDRANESRMKAIDYFSHLWHNELFAEGRSRAASWAQETTNRIRKGALPLSPVLLYEDLVALLKDHMWRRSALIFLAGAIFGCSAGLVMGLRWARAAPTGPLCRALHSLADGSVILVEDAMAPSVGAEDILVRVQAFSVCPIDRAVLRGHGAALRNLITRTQVTVGRGFSGVVLDVGAGVVEYELGDEVWGCFSEWNGGAAIELLTLRRTRLSKRPSGLNADEAASMPCAGTKALTALQILDYNPENCNNKRVCICGAGSGEGCILVQLLSTWGASITVTAPAHKKDRLKLLGASNFISVDAPNTMEMMSWEVLERDAKTNGLWDSVIICSGYGSAPGLPAHVIRTAAPKNSMLDLRPRALFTDRIPSPFTLVFSAGFMLYRVLRWTCGRGRDTDFLEEVNRTTVGLEALRQLVESKQLTPVLDKVYGPQDFELALAHSCSEDSVGSTVIRFP